MLNLSGYELKIMKLKLNTLNCYIIVFNETLRVTHDTCRDMKRKLRYANMDKQEIITAIKKSCIINDPDLINYNYCILIEIRNEFFDLIGREAVRT